MTAIADPTVDCTSSSLANDVQSRDPFWHSTPRSMAAVQQVMASPPQPPPALPQRPPRAPAPTAASRRPQCTHMSMSRSHSAISHCMMCGKMPSLGWLYTCQQDRDLRTGCADFTELSPSTEARDGKSNGEFVQYALEAESLDMSTVVIKGIRKGDYSPEQVQQLIEQKKHLRAVIRSAQNPDNTATVSESPAPGVIIASVGSTVPDSAPAVQPSLSPSQTGNMTLAANTGVAAPAAQKSSRRSKRQRQSCHFQVCHTCRPFFTERLPMSFERMLSGRVPAVTEHDIARLPIMNPSIVRNLGLRQTPLPAPPANRSPSLNNAVRQTDGHDDDSWSSTPTSATNSDSDSEQLELVDRYPCPGPGLCPLWSSFSGCAYDGGFDDGLKALNHGFDPEPETDLDNILPENSLSHLFSATPGGASAGGSSISLPSLCTAPLTPLQHDEELFEDLLLGIKLGRTKGKAKTICAGVTERALRPGRLAIPLGSGFGAKDSSSSLGSEVEVDGGVALTEEAVESGIPDIITDLDKCD